MDGRGLHGQALVSRRSAADLRRWPNRVSFGTAFVRVLTAQAEDSKQPVHYLPLFDLLIQAIRGDWSGYEIVSSVWNGRSADHWSPAPLYWAVCYSTIWWIHLWALYFLLSVWYFLLLLWCASRPCILNWRIERLGAAVVLAASCAVLGLPGLSIL